MNLKHQNYINHIALVLDASGSMDHLASSVVQVADNQVAHLALRSKELDQETRATVYTFDDASECVYYDKDVLRMPSLKGAYKIGGATGLCLMNVVSVAFAGQVGELSGSIGRWDFGGTFVRFRRSSRLFSTTGSTR